MHEMATAKSGWGWSVYCSRVYSIKWVWLVGLLFTSVLHKVGGAGRFAVQSELHKWVGLVGFCLRVCCIKWVGGAG